MAPLKGELSTKLTEGFPPFFFNEKDTNRKDSVFFGAGNVTRPSAAASPCILFAKNVSLKHFYNAQTLACSSH